MMVICLADTVGTIIFPIYQKFAVNYVDRYDLIKAFILCGFSYDVKEINNNRECKFKGKLDVRKFKKIQERIGKYKREQSIYDDPLYSSPFLIGQYVLDESLPLRD
jgi:hypothetical protein